MKPALRLNAKPAFLFQARAFHLMAGKLKHKKNTEILD
jgi:hypothetical protein